MVIPGVCGNLTLFSAGSAVFLSPHHCGSLDVSLAGSARSFAASARERQSGGQDGVLLKAMLPEAKGAAREHGAACERLGIECASNEYEGSEKEAIDLVLGLNMSRRHLTPSQRAAVAVNVLPMYEKAARERQGTRTDLSLKTGEGRKATGAG